MDEFREVIPTLTGPGAFLITLIVLGLLAMGWDLSDDGLLIAGLVAFSLPLSVFITQVYHAYHRKRGFKNRPYIKIIREQGKKDWKEF